MAQPIRLRIRGPSGQSQVTLGPDSATVSHLRAQITEKTGLTSYNVKAGYPPKPLDIDSCAGEEAAANVGVRSGEQLTITSKETRRDVDGGVSAVDGAGGGKSAPAATAAAATTTGTPAQNPSHAWPPATKEPLSLARKNKTDLETDPPQIPAPEYDGTVVLRIMPDDNSCLFRAVGRALLGSDLDAMNELRSVVAQNIQSQPERFSSAILGKDRDEYCRWIQRDSAWGGQIELIILSEHFNVQICCVDVKTLRVDRYNDPENTPATTAATRPTTQCVIVYSGIHYDAIAVSPSEPPYTQSTATPDFDTMQFSAADDMIVLRSEELCRQLQQKNYYTDTANFRIRCGNCGGIFQGETGALKHAQATGHQNFGEA